MTVATPGLLPDEAARRTIASGLDETLFVEAGAGTGKTSTLVDRVYELVRDGTALRSIAAITFTEAAAAELRDRIRHRIEQGEHSGTLPAGTVDQLDEAAICTLHAFAQRLLAQFPVEAGLPPGFEVLDEIESGLDFDKRWQAFLDDLYDRPDLADVLLRGFATGLQVDNLAVLARRFHDHRDRLAAAPIVVPPDPPVDVSAPIAALRGAAELCVHALDASDLLAKHIAGTPGSRPNGGGYGDNGDELREKEERVEGFAEMADRLAAAHDEIDQLYVLVHRRRLTCGKGRRANWAIDIDTVKEACNQAHEACDAVVSAVRTHIAARLAEEVRRFTIEAAAGRMLEGRLAFHDLLVCARDLLRDRSDVRARLADRWRRLLIDEFQDTDPLQVELAVLLASEATSTGEEAVGSADGNASRLSPGRLFFVGDAKQSIYRFRRADIALFNEVRDQLDVDPVALTTNFRSVPGIIDWVNDVFAELLAPADGQAGESDEADAPPDVAQVPEAARHQARHQPLAAHRSAISSAAVRVIGQPRAAGLGEVRTVEAAEIASTIAAAIAEGWPIADRSQAEDASHPAVRPARYRDIAILLPARTTLPYLEDALDQRAIPYRVESASLVWDTQPVRDLLALLRAIDDPADRIRVGTALRCSPGGCSDDDLLAYREAGGHWALWATPPASLPEDHPVVVALARLRALHDQHWWLGVAGLVDAVVRRFHLMELALASDRARDRWRQLRFVIDQARAFAEQPGATMRGFLAWADEQAANEARVREPVLPEDDHDAVRVLTIHGAKGLEFPITILCGLNRMPHSTDPVDVVWNADGPQVRIGKGFVTPAYDEAAQTEKELANDERRRLLYVAATRGRDHLIVSAHRTERDQASDAALLAAACESRPTHWEPYDPPALTLLAPPSTPPPAPSEAVLHERRQWNRRRDELIAGQRRAPVVAATAVAVGAAVLDSDDAREPEGTAEAERQTASPLAVPVSDLPPASTPELDRSGGKPEPSPEAEPWRRGRAGTAIGRAVHAVLQTVDLTTPAGGAPSDLDALARTYAIAEAIGDRAVEVARLVRTALASDVVAEAASRRHWRELYVAAPLDGGVIEGFVDLLYDDRDGLVVVDYKTDTVRTDAEVETALDRYRLQLGAYAFAVERTTGRPVRRAGLLFVSGGKARTRWLSGDELVQAANDAAQRAAGMFTASRLAGR